LSVGFNGNFVLQKRSSIDCGHEIAGTFCFQSQNALERLPFEVLVWNVNQMRGSFFKSPAASLSPQQTQPGQTSGDNKDPKKDDPKNDPSTTHDRLFFALPNFVTMESTVHVAPLTAKQKFQVAVRSSFDYVQYPWYGVLAGISQAQNSETSYGQGAEGYAKR
jgi:hypothetical protein